MSSKRQVFDIYPCEGSFSNYTEENKFFGFSCPSCNGRGYFDVYERNEVLKKDCGRCKGAGKLKATVKIEWEAEI